MSIGRVNFNDVTGVDLHDLLKASVPEGLTLEYKREMYGSSDAEKKEALKDITSFANSIGGHLVIGIEAINGVAARLSGLADEESDATVNRLESLVRDGIEPRIFGIRIRAISLGNGRCVIIIRIPKSWNPPHRVIAAKSNRFFVRNSGGVHEASLEELRMLFTMSKDTYSQIKQFSADRIAKIIAGQGPVVIPSGGRLILHLIPLSAMGIYSKLDMEAIFEINREFCPLSMETMTPRFNLDGVINVGGGEQDRAYTQVFRNGIVEATQSRILINMDNQKVLHAKDTIRYVTTAITSYLNGMQSLNIQTPICIIISYQGISNAKLGIKGYEHSLDKIDSLPLIDPLSLPDVILEDYGTPMDYIKAIKPSFDALWNAAGFSGCTYYDISGNLTLPR